MIHDIKVAIDNKANTIRNISIDFDEYNKGLSLYEITV